MATQAHICLVTMEAAARFPGEKGAKEKSSFGRSLRSLHRDDRQAGKQTQVRIGQTHSTKGTA